MSTEVIESNLIQGKMTQLALPSLGEGIEKGTVISIMVKPGDTVVLEQTLMEVETDKVVVEVPSEAEGEITKLLVRVGDEISKGTPFLELSVNGASEELQAAEKPTEDKKVEVEVEPKETAPREEVKEISIPASTSEPQQSRVSKVRATPLARKLAREIGIDIGSVSSSSPNGRIGVKDVKAYSKQLNRNKGSGVGLTAPITLPDFSKWGAIRRESIAGITQATSKNMSTTWSQIPHAWLQEKVDITALEAKRQKHKQQIKEEGGALTITSILVKVTAKALEKFPVFNASFDAAANEIIHKDYINIGVAVDSERGLLVPVLRDVEKKGILEISQNLVALSQKVKEKKTKPEELEGGTFTISNLGGIGTSAIFPLVNHPQLAILGVAASQTEAVWVNGQFEPRALMPLTIGFDHRIINGADAARFLKHVKELLEDWFLWSL